MKHICLVSNTNKVPVTSRYAFAKRQMQCLGFGVMLFAGIGQPSFSATLPSDSAPPYAGEALLIVYPDYPVNTDTFYGYTTLVGHAGVLLISPSGVTKYFEFGRYDPQKNGVIRAISPIPNVQIDADGKASAASLSEVLKVLSHSSGKDGRIRAAYFVRMNYDEMVATANQAPGVYDVASNNCGHFVERVILAGHPQIDKPLVVNFVPNNFVDEYIEEGNAELLYNPANNTLTIGPSDEADAKE